MKQFGIIGFPLSHSFSPGYFAAKFEREEITDANYAVFPLEKIEYFSDLCLEFPNLKGLNVTIPYKEKIIAYLDELSEEAQKIGAINTILFSDGKKTGYNTDIHGFENSLQPLLNNTHKQALILGTGGAAKAVEYVLQKLGIGYRHVSRHETENAYCYEDLFDNDSLMQTYTLIINTSPIGMYPNTNESPNIPYEKLTQAHLLYDLVYNPENTLFMQCGAAQGATVKNGLDMLYLQAEKSWEIWNKKPV